MTIYLKIIVNNIYQSYCTLKNVDVSLTFGSSRKTSDINIIIRFLLFSYSNNFGLQDFKLRSLLSLKLFDSPK